MPKPIPERMPEELVSEAEYLGMAMNQFAEYKGLNPNRFYTLFGGSHAQMRPYCKLADVSNQSLDQVAEFMLARQNPRLIDIAMKVAGCQNLRQLSLKCGVSDQWMRNLILKNDGELKGLYSYYEAANALGWSLDKMRKACKM